MMRKYISILALLAVFNACHDDRGDEAGKEKEALTVNANIAVSVHTGGQTRADEEFTKNFDLYLKRTAPVVDSYYTLHEATHNVSKYLITKNNLPWYWDDNGGISAQLDMIGIYPKGAGVIEDLSELSFSWSVDANQTSVDHDQLDLRISALKKDYTLGIQKNGTAAEKKMEFSHVLSQLTFVLEKGEGFEEDEEFKPTIETIDLQTKGNVVIDDNGTVTVTPDTDAATQKKMTPQLMNNSTERTFVAIAIPNQKFEKNEEFAAISLTINGETNKYSIKLPTDQEIVFLQGTNHQFKIIVNKTQSKFLTATLKCWDESDVTEKEVNINVENNNENGISDVKGGAKLYVMIKKGNAGEEVEVDENLRRTTTYKSSGWESFDSSLYWDDIPKTDKTFAFGLLFNNENAASAEINENPEDIYMVKTEKLDQAYQYLIFKDMAHPFSRLDIQILTEKEKPYAVDLTKLKSIRFNSQIQKFKEIDTGTQVITYHSNIDTDLSDVGLNITDANITPSQDSQYDLYDVPPVYIKPGITVSEGVELLRIFYDNDSGVLNEYPLVLDAGATFKANEKRQIIITLSKTEITKKVVTIQEWTTIPNPIEGNGTIKE